MYWNVPPLRPADLSGMIQMPWTTRWKTKRCLSEEVPALSYTGELRNQIYSVFISDCLTPLLFKNCELIGLIHDLNDQSVGLRSILGATGNSSSPALFCFWLSGPDNEPGSLTRRRPPPNGWSCIHHWIFISRYPYYLGVGHSTNLRNHTGHTRRVYRAHLILLTVEPQFRVVFVSDPLKVHSTIYQMFRGKRFWNIVEDRYVPSLTLPEHPEWTSFFFLAQLSRCASAVILHPDDIELNHEAWVKPWGTS